jgi:tetratricopeptide (TPR) repeat protein
VAGESRPLPASYDALRDEVMALVADLRRRHADAPETIDLEASMHDRFGNLAAATALWEGWLSTHPDFPEAHLRLGKYAKERGDDEAAIDHLRRAFEKRPELPGAQVLLGELLTNVGRADEAVAVLDRGLPSTAGNPNRLLLLGHARLQTGDFLGAKADFIRALDLVPGSPQALYGLGTACARLGEDEESRRHLAAFAARKEETLARDRATADARLDDLPSLGLAAAGWYATAGKIDAARGDPAAAERHWLRALDFSPGQRDAVTSLVERWRRQGRDGDARAIV